MKVRHGWLLAMLAVGVLFSGTGCSNAGKERDALRKQNADYEKQLAADKADRADMQKKLDDMNMRLLAQGNTPPAPAVPETPAATPAAAPDSTPDMGPAEDGGIKTLKTARGETELEIVGDVLFAPGKAALKPTSKKVLEKAVSMIKSKYTGHRLRVEGHTDPTPVRSSGWDDNYDLGAARARAVLLFLKAHGIPEKSMYIASFGANELKSTKNLALDRRVDIVVEK